MGKIFYPFKSWDRKERNNDIEDKELEEIQSHSWDNETVKPYRKSILECDHKTFSWVYVNSKYRLKVCSKCGKTIEIERTK